MDPRKLSRRSANVARQAIANTGRGELRWLEVENEQGDVVLLCAGGVEAGECCDVGEKIVGKMSGRKMPMGLQEFFAAPLAKFFSRSITRFEHSVGVEETTVSAGDSNFHR